MSDYLAALFRRRPNDGWFRAGRYDATTTDILCALAVASMFLWAISGTLFELLVFNAPQVRSGQLWRLVTWPIAEPPNLGPLLGIIFFWLFGQQIEGLFGRNKFLIWVLTVAIVPSVSLTLLGLLNDNFDFTSFALGLSLLFLGGIWVYAATYPGVRWFEIIPLWALAAVFTVLQLLQFTGRRASGGILFLLIAIGAALVGARSLGFATGWPIPHIDLANIGGGGSHRRPTRRPKRSRGSSGRGQVVDGPWRNAPAPLAPPTGPSVADQAELDGLLDKIGAEGMDALSSAEKKRLNELSKRLRKD